MPVMVPGTAGTVLSVIPRVFGEVEPQVLLAVTVMFPPEVFATALIELVVETPVHPGGRVQV